MSYILDALQKAEAERKLGAVPGIYTPATQTAASAPGSRRMLWLGAVLTALAMVLAALAWWRPWHSPQNAGLPAIPDSALPAPAKPVPVPVPAMVQRSKEAAPQPRPVPMPGQPAVSTLQPPAEKPLKPKAAAAAAAASVPKPIADAAPVATSRTPQPEQKTAAVQIVERQGKESEPLTLRELPEQIQRDIPALTIGGYIYSNNPAERSLLINNKLLREGDEVAPGLTLEKMMRGNVVLSYKGYRYRMPY